MFETMNKLSQLKPKTSQETTCRAPFGNRHRRDNTTYYYTSSPLRIPASNATSIQYRNHHAGPNDFRSTCPTSRRKVYNVHTPTFNSTTKRLRFRIFFPCALYFR